MPDSNPIPATDPKPASRFKNKKMHIGAAASCIVIAIIVLILALFISNQQSKNNSGGDNNTPATPTSTGQSSETVEPTPPPTSSTTTSTPTPVAGNDTIYYIKDNNIFSFNYVTNNELQLTTFGSGGSGYVSTNHLNQVNNNTLGFSKCATVEGDYGCGIFTLNLSNNSVTEIKHISGDKLLLDLKFDTPTRFAYLVESTAARSLILHNGTDQVLEDVAVQPYGRGGFEGDAQHMQFSPDHNKLLQISTSSARSSMDFNTYVYNLTTIGQPPVIVANSTHPIWLNNNHILYLGYQQSGGGSQGFKVFDVPTSGSTPFTSAISTNNVYYPALSPNGQQVIYTKFDTKEVWLYNTASNTTSLIVGEAIDAEWVDSTHLVVSKVHICLPDEICNSMTDYENTGVGIYDLSSNSYVANLPSGVYSTYSVATLYK